MNAKVAQRKASRKTRERRRKQLEARQRRIDRRLDKRRFPLEYPVFSASNIHYEIGDRTRAIGCGGIGMIHQMAVNLGLDQTINEELHIFKRHFPYTESDHILNIAYNLLAGGTHLEHLELRRQDEAYLDAVGAMRIPDPTTAGDFCRRFWESHIDRLMEAINKTRLKVWSLQPPSFLEGEVFLDADGTMVETTGECKQGIDVNYKGQWGYAPLVVSVGNTGEPLYIHNRPGNRPSHEGAGFYLDKAVSFCHRAGVEQVTLRGDTDFTQTGRLDGWHEQGVRFIFGIDARENLYQRAEELPEMAWKRLQRPPRYEVATEPRRRPENVKQQIVVEREFEDIHLLEEYVADFAYQPSKCHRPYRVVVVWKELEVTRGLFKQFDQSRCFFYITNDWERSPEEIVRLANARCNQENLIQQLKSDVRALTAPLDNLESNWAYMVIASLAWTLKVWAGMLLPVEGRWHKKHTEEKQKLVRMDFTTFRNAIINVPAQIIRTGRRLVYRLLGWNRWQPVFFRLVDRLSMPLLL